MSTARPAGEALDELLTLLLTRELPPAAATLPEWWQSVRPVREAFPSPVARAVASGLFADRVAWAFGAGYQAALAALFPSLGLHEVAALCATESTGARPRDIATRLAPGPAGFRLSGAKQWTTAAPLASSLFVVATTGQGPDGRNQLKVVRVPATAHGVRMNPLADLPFVPELPHASVEFADVDVAPADVLAGDGYAQYLKPFRTVEDLHVHGALLGYLVSLARRFEWPRSALEDLVALVATCVALAEAPRAAASTHVALAGFLAESHRCLERCAPHFDCVAADERARWERDRPLLQVAEKARTQRLARAWETLAVLSRR